MPGARAGREHHGLDALPPLATVEESSPIVLLANSRFARSPSGGYIG